MLQILLNRLYCIDNLVTIKHHKVTSRQWRMHPIWPLCRGSRGREDLKREGADRRFRVSRTNATNLRFRIRSWLTLAGRMKWARHLALATVHKRTNDKTWPILVTGILGPSLITASTVLWCDGLTEELAGISRKKINSEICQAKDHRLLFGVS